MVSITLLDIIILAFCAAEIILSARRGFAVTSCGVVGNLIALLGGILSARPGTQALLRRAGGGGDAAVVGPLVFAVVFLLLTVLWQYACLHFDLMDRFPRSRRFEQLYGGALGLLKAAVLSAAALYVLSGLSILPVVQLRSSLLLGRLWRLWQGLG